MSSQFHAVGGLYSKEERWVGLDYATSFMKDAAIVESIVAHELSHAIIAGTDYGQASFVVFNLVDKFGHVPINEAKEIASSIFDSQVLTQEGLATFMQVGRLRARIGKTKALEWAQANLPKSYTDKLAEFAHIHKASKSHREHFMTKASALAMTNGFRQHAAGLDLLASTSSLNEYLADPNNSPDARLRKILELLRHKPWAITKSLEEIANLAGIAYFEPATKEEIAAFQTYVVKLTGDSYEFLPQDIGDPVAPDLEIQRAAESLFVTNLNLQLAESSELLMKREDFVFYADVVDTVFVNYIDETWDKRDLVMWAIGEAPDVSLVSFTKTGEKYVFYCSKATAAQILNEEFKDATLVVKWGGYSIEKDGVIWSGDARPPDIVLYNTPTHLQETFSKHLEADPDVKFRHLHIGTTLDHPLQSLMATIEGKTPLHLVSDFGNARISKAVELLKKNSSLLQHDELRAHGKHINNTLTMLGLLRQVDWVETMIDQKDLIMRKD